MSSNVSRNSTGVNNVNLKQNDRGQKNYSSRSSVSASVAFCCSFDCFSCLIRNVKYRQHLRAFRSIGIITLVGVLCCLYPIFMHELRPVRLTNHYSFDLKQKITHTRPVDWKRCYYSRKHEYAYDIIGIILTSFLHILPLTFVAAMNIMIIVRLRQRQRLMSSSATTTTRSTIINKKKRTSLNYLGKQAVYRLTSLTPTDIPLSHMKQSLSQPSFVTTHKDQETLTEPSVQTIKSESTQIQTGSRNNPRRRHHLRNKNITIMLVSVALSYFILTLPYRLFWSYNVYIKRMHPEKLNSSIYLLKMHFIDHLLRTIRNLHYGTNFIFFIFLSKPFRRKFRQLFTGNFCFASQQFFARCTKPSSNTDLKTHNQQEYSMRLEETNEISQNLTIIKEKTISKNVHSTKNGYYETSSLMDDARIQAEISPSIIELEHTESL